MATAETTLEQRAVRIVRRFDVAVVRDYGVVIAFVALFITLSVTSNVFFTSANMKNLAFQTAPIGIMAVGGTLVFIGGGFDLSVGAVSAFSGIIAAKTFVGTGVGLWGSLVIGVLAGLGCGIANGLLVTLGRVNAFIATLATAIVINGIAQVMTSGNLIGVEQERFTKLGLGTAGGVQYPVYVWAGVALVAGFLLWLTKFGRYVYAAGGNAEAARLAGVRVNVVKAATFAFSGMCAGIAGVILVSEVSTAQWDANRGVEFDVITAIVLGGVSLLGGEGAVWRAVLGAFFLQTIGNGFNLLGTSTQWQYVIKGVILATAVSLDAWARRRRA
jgi:ribose transport system permease protein